MKSILNMTVGQTEIHPVIKETINDSIPVPTYFKEYKDIQTEMLEKAKIILNTKMPVYLKLGIGRMGLETGLYNVIDDKTKVLTLDNGRWGHFGGELATNMGATVEYLSGERGKDINYSLLEEKLSSNKYDIITMVQNETETGTLYDVEKVSKVINKVSPNTILFVDAISSFGGTEIYFDKWGIDIIVTGSQKCLNAPQGCPLVCYSQKAIDRKNSLKNKKFYYATALENNPEFLFARGLNDLFGYMINTGLDVIYNNHKKAAKAVRKALLKLGLNYMADEKLASPSTTRIIFPDELQKQIHLYREEKGIDQDIVTSIMKDKYGVCIAEDRIGTMGYYIRKEDIISTISALSDTLNDLGYKNSKEKALKAVEETYME